MPLLMSWCGLKGLKQKLKKTWNWTLWSFAFATISFLSSLWILETREHTCVLLVVMESYYPVWGKLHPDTRTPQRSNPSLLDVGYRYAANEHVCVVRGVLVLWPLYFHPHWWPCANEPCWACTYGLGHMGTHSAHSAPLHLAVWCLFLFFFPLLQSECWRHFATCPTQP